MAQIDEQRVYNKTHVFHFTYNGKMYQVRNKTKLLQLFKRLGIVRAYFGDLKRPKNTWRGIFSVSGFNNYIPAPTAANPAYYFDFLLEHESGEVVEVRISVFIAGFTDLGCKASEAFKM